MNSVEAYKSFITFLILVGILALSILGFNLIFRSSNQQAKADLNSKSDPNKLEAESKNSPAIDKSNQLSQPIIESEVPNPLSTGVQNEQNKSNNLNYESVSKDDDSRPDNIGITQTGISDSNDNLNSQSIQSSDNTIDTGSPILETTKPDPDAYNGFDDPVEYNTNIMVLGKQTSQLNQNQINEFKEAVRFQDTRYDFNQDSIVDTKDYPLFINFINSKDD